MKTEEDPAVGPAVAAAAAAVGPMCPLMLESRLLLSCVVIISDVVVVVSDDGLELDWAAESKVDIIGE